MSNYSNDIDIGNKIRIRRRNLKITQGQLAEFAGCTAQQIQKYEGGYTRISMPVFLKICQFLNTHPSYFFSTFSLRESSDGLQNEDLEEKLLNIFRSVTNEKIKEKIVNLVEAVVSNSQSE